MLKAGQIATTQITDYTSDGQGICRIDGCAVFVPNAIAGELCRIKVVKAGRNTAVGKIEQIIEKSPHRIPRACPYGKLCGGCQFQHMDYGEETSLKARRVAQALVRLGGVPLADVPITSAGEIQGYRNKAQYPVAMEKGKAVAGFYRERTHQVVPIRRCFLLPPEADAAKDCVVEWMNRYKVSTYNEQTGKGLVRHIYVRKAWATGQILVCIVANGGTLPHVAALIEGLTEAVPGLMGLVLSVNHKAGNSILGDKFITLYGQDYIEDVLCGLTFRISPRSFYQVNHDQAQRLYEKAVKAASLTEQDTVLDLYCGTGTITLALARKAGRAIGVEIIAQAIEDARENARRNGIDNAEFFCADATDAAQRLAAQGISPDVIVVDPPRKGLAPEVIRAMAEMAPKRIIYVSCDPATLARDIKLLTQCGYGLNAAEAVDMFPRCAHVESVVLMSSGE